MDSGSGPGSRGPKKGRNSGPYERETYSIGETDLKAEERTVLGGRDLQSPSEKDLRTYNLGEGREGSKGSRGTQTIDRRRDLTFEVLQSLVQTKKGLLRNRGIYLESVLSLIISCL